MCRSLGVMFVIDYFSISPQQAEVLPLPGIYSTARDAYR